jgi:hypothetical protein
MSSIFFDAGPIISITMNHLLNFSPDIKRCYGGDFFITPGVKKELVDNPSNIKRFKLEALQTLHFIDNGTFKVKRVKGVRDLTFKILNLANSCFKFENGDHLKIVHFAEAESVASAIILKSDAVVIDEKTMRLLIEDPSKLCKILSGKMHRKVIIDSPNLKRLSSFFKSIKIIRSVELVSVAFELGVFDELISNTSGARENFLDALLWGIKLEGCAVSEKEIRIISKLQNPVSRR